MNEQNEDQGSDFEEDLNQNEQNFVDYELINTQISKNQTSTSGNTLTTTGLTLKSADFGIIGDQNIDLLQSDSSTNSANSSNQKQTQKLQKSDQKKNDFEAASPNYFSGDFTPSTKKKNVRKVPPPALD